MRAFNCMIVDDERAAIDVISQYINEHPMLTLLYTTTQPDEVEGLLNVNHIDILFLDIHMKGRNGWEIKKAIDPSISVIFCSADNSRGSDVFEVDGVEYLVKPFTVERFNRAVSRAIDRKNSVAKAEKAYDLHDFISMKCGKQKYRRVDLLDIDYVTTDLKRVQVYTTYGIITVDHTLGDLMEKLPDKHFVQVNKSSIVAVSRIDIMNANSIVLKGKQAITFSIGAKYRPALERITKR